MPTYDCGCRNEIDAPSGVLKNISKCEFHQKWSREHPQGESIEYFKAMGCFDENGIPQNKRLIDELEDTLEDLNLIGWPETANALEIGCGLGAYIPFFNSLGYSYVGIEPSNFAYSWLVNCFNAAVFQGTFEQFWMAEQFEEPYDVIFAAHVFEHMKEAPEQLQKAYNLLEEGGLFFIIVPDDGDPTNPDHLWFFTQATLHALLEKIGFRNVRSTIKKVVPQENFIYCVAEK